ncbi:unnamed protein product [Phytomonas sp. EM1]|nr:unnamed protein product [Phytomonas sp. EM1]|eukprot:CCW61427.1 unnamed protein product [Phytomonas sp. isolate EM1]
MPMWFFPQLGSSNDAASEIKPITNIAHSGFFNKDDAKDRRKGEGDVASYTSEFDRLRIPQSAIGRRDGRINNPDVESIECLLARFGKEMNIAEELISKKKETKARLALHNYEADPRYQMWSEDRKKMLNRLQIHWIDQIIDSPFECMVYLLRITTTVGLCYGVGRTSYLYRTMDKVYAKLNGVTLSRLAFQEITLAVTKSSGAAFAGIGGVFIGKVLSSLASVAWSGEVSSPDRAWWHVASCGLGCGIMSGASLGLMNYGMLTPKGIKMLVGMLGGVGGAVGLYFGYFVYKPFSETRTHRLYDAYWHPWYERRLKMDGGGNVRG